MDPSLLSFLQPPKTRYFKLPVLDANLQYGSHPYAVLTRQKRTNEPHSQHIIVWAAVWSDLNSVANHTTKIYHYCGHLISVLSTLYGWKKTKGSLLDQKAYYRAEKDPPLDPVFRLIMLNYIGNLLSKYFHCIKVVQVALKLIYLLTPWHYSPDRHKPPLIRFHSLI
jgi:hypothetical protein